MNQKMFFKKERDARVKYLIYIIALIFAIILLVIVNRYKCKYISEAKSLGNEMKNIRRAKNMEKNLGKMPTWDLSDLYSSINDPKINEDLKKIESQINDFQKYKGKITKLNGRDLYNAIIKYEQISELMTKLSCYAYLKYSENLSLDENIKFHQKITETLTHLSSNLIFFSLEINKISNSRIKTLYAESKSLKVYKPVIDKIRLFKDHQLNENLEKLMLDKSVASRNAWSRLFDETMDNMEFDYNGKKLNQSQILELMNSKDENVRRETSKIFGETLGKNGKLFAFITNTLAEDKEVDDKWRNFKTPISEMNLSNEIDDQVVESLRETVKKNYINTAHRYYAWKAKMLGKQKLHYYDRNAPLPFDDDEIYSWQDAEDIVLSAYSDFSPAMANIGKEFFDKNWIDVPTRPGKTGGAYAMQTTPSAHPYILLNYQGKSRDVMTIAHELGHGIHQTLSAKQGLLMSGASLTLSETASVFGEQLAFQKILAQEQDTEKKKAILARKIEDMINTVVRQIAFLDFETVVHNERKNGEIPLERLNQIWLQVQKESLGDENFIFDDEYKNYWMYIPHFIHSPFYVYSYAFGDCLVNSLYEIYKKNPKGFEQKYISLLEAGSSKNYIELLKPFNLNPKDPRFWQEGLDVLNNMIDQLEALN